MRWYLALYDCQINDAGEDDEHIGLEIDYPGYERQLIAFAPCGRGVKSVGDVRFPRMPEGCGCRVCFIGLVTERTGPCEPTFVMSTSGKLKLNHWIEARFAAGEVTVEDPFSEDEP